MSEHEGNGVGGVDAGGNPVFGIERHGFDFIPEHERTMTLREGGLFWVAANANLFFVTVGVIAFGLGLSLWQALLAVVVGNALFAYVAYASIAGVRAGLPNMTLTRAAFGIRGNRLHAFFAWVTSVAFEVINTVFGAFAVLALFGVLGWQDPGVVGRLLALAAVFGLSAVVAVLGHATMVYVERIFAVLLVVALALVFFYVVGGVDWGAGPEDPLPVGAAVGLLLVAAGVVAAGPLSYLWNAADFLRYLPSRTSSGSIFWTVLLAGGGMAVFLGAMGVLLASRGDMSDPVAGVQPFVPGWLFLVYIFAVVGGTIANNVLTFYSSGLLTSMSVSMGPGATEFTSTPLDATSFATDLVMAMTPPLEAL